MKESLNLNDPAEFGGLGNLGIRESLLFSEQIGIVNLIQESRVSKYIADMAANVKETNRAAEALRSTIAESFQLESIFPQKGLMEIVAPKFYEQIEGIKFPNFFEQGIMSRFDQECRRLQVWNSGISDSIAKMQSAFEDAWRPGIAETFAKIYNKAEETDSHFKGLDSWGASSQAAASISEMAMYRAIAFDSLDENLGPFLTATEALISEEGEIIYEAEPRFDRRILESGIDSILFEAVRRNPANIYKMSPREFEQFVAEIFSKKGFDVTLTPQTQDGGYDIMAIRNCELTGPQTHLIECKRYAPGKNISVGVVRGLHGVVTDFRATKGIIVTTSGFSKPARQYEQRNLGQINLKDVNALSAWLRDLKG